MNQVPLSAKLFAKDYNRKFDFKILGYRLITVTQKITYARNILTGKAVMLEHLVSTVDNSMPKKQYLPSLSKQITMKMTEPS